MFAEYAEPKSEEEMRERYAKIRRSFYDLRGHRGVPQADQCHVVTLADFNAHIIAYYQWKLARQSGLSKAQSVLVVEQKASTLKPVWRIIAEEAASAGLSVADIKGPRRTRVVAFARHAAMARVYMERPDLSLPQIGRLFGGRDHTTVLHAVKRMGVHVECKQDNSEAVA